VRAWSLVTAGSDDAEADEGDAEAADDDVPDAPAGDRPVALGAPVEG